MIDWEQFALIKRVRESGHAESALEQLKQLIQSVQCKQDMGAILLNIGLCYTDLKLWDEAKHAVEEAVRCLASDDSLLPFAEFSRAVVYERAGEMKTAAKLMTQFLATPKSSDESILYPTMRSDAQVRLAAMLISLEQHQEAIDVLRQLRLSSPDPNTLAEVCYWEGTALRELNRIDEAIEMLKSATSGDLDHRLISLAHYRTGEAYYSLGMFASALTEFEAAASNGGDTSIVGEIDEWLRLTEAKISSGEKLQ